MKDVLEDVKAALPAHRQNGRTPPPLPEVTLQDSGYTVEFRPLGPLTTQEIRKTVERAMPGPRPPMNEVIGLDGKEHQEPNPADPDYQAELLQHSIDVEIEIGDRLFKLIARQSIASPIDAEAVARIRANLTEIGVVVPEDDRDVFVRHVLIASHRDMTDLQKAIMRRSQPTPEAVAEAVAEFRRDVQGP